jgi:hypothetical protein
MAQREFRLDDTSVWPERFGNGSDGAISVNTSTDATANTTISAASGSTSATVGSGTGFATGNLLLIHQTRNGGAGAGAWELNKVSSVGGGTNWTLAYATTQAYDTTAQVYLLKQYSTVTINSGQTLTGSAWDGSKGGIVAFLCNGAITVPGSINVDGKGFRGHNSSHLGAGTQGEGTSGSGSQSTSANGNAGGGGPAGGTATASGGSGGHVAVGAAGSGSTGGGIVGNTGLTTINFGGAGGSGGTQGGSANPYGGNGGGIVILIGKTITITGSIISTGAFGDVHGDNQGAGGGGAGGSILLKGQIITLGSSLITATASSQELAGSSGRIHADYSSSLSGTTSPTIDTRQDSSLADSSFLAFM